MSRDAGDTAGAAVGVVMDCDNRVDIERVDASVEGVDETNACPDATLPLFGVDAVA